VESDVARAAELLATNGPNALPEERAKPAWVRIVEQYRSYLQVILVGAAIVSLMLLVRRSQGVWSPLRWQAHLGVTVAEPVTWGGPKQARLGGTEVPPFLGTTVPVSSSPGAATTESADPDCSTPW